MWGFGWLVSEVNGTWHTFRKEQFTIGRNVARMSCYSHIEWWFAYFDSL